MYLFPVVEYFYDEFYYTGIFADIIRGSMLEGNPHNNANYMPNLLDSYLVKRISLENFCVVYQALLYDVQALFNSIVSSQRIELFHDSTRILNNSKEFREDIHSALIADTKIEIKKSIFDELVHQKDLQMSLLFLFFQDFDNLDKGTLVIAEDAMMLQIFQTFRVKPLIFNQSVEHLAENSIIGPQHHPKVNVPIHFVDKDRVNRGIYVQQANSLDQVSLPLTIAIPQASHQLGEMIPIYPVMLKDAINQSHESHSTPLEVIQGAIQVHDTILDLLSYRIHGIDIQCQVIQLIIHFLESEDTVLRGQFFQSGIGDRLDHGDLLIGRLHRISNYLKISSSGQSLQFYQMKCSQFPADEKAKCLALQRVRARIIKDNFINEGSINREEIVTKQVIKYSTLLSEKMLHKIKTEELREFEKDVQSYCRESQKMCEMRRQKQASLKQVNVSQLLSEYKNSTKVRLLQNNKKRTKTSQGFQLAIEPGRLTSPEPEIEPKVLSPLGNKKIKEAIQQNRKKLTPAGRFRINGKGINSQIIQLLEKLDEIESIQKLRRRREVMNDEEEYLQRRSDHLKKEKDRLSTAFQNHERSKFKPMGKIKKDQKYSLDRNDFRIQELDYLKKLHNRVGKATMLQPLKRSAIIVSSNFVGKASIHLEQGLPRSIKNQIPIKIKKSQSSINDDQKQEVINCQSSITPPLLRSNNLFITNNFT